MDIFQIQVMKLIIEKTGLGILDLKTQEIRIHTLALNHGLQKQ